MTVGFILNGEDVEITADAQTRLSDILRARFGLLGAKTGCLSGKCGACSVIFNDSVIHACLIPAFSLRDGEIITVEGFSQTDEYRDITEGFAAAGAGDCGFCRSAKILAAWALLERRDRPSRQEIIRAYGGIRCRCTDPVLLIEGTEKAAAIRQRRLRGR